MWREFRVDWEVRGTSITFSRFGVNLMHFMRNRAWEYNGTLEVKEGSARLIGAFSVPARINSDEFMIQIGELLEANRWIMGGSTVDV